MRLPQPPTYRFSVSIQPAILTAVAVLLSLVSTNALAAGTGQLSCSPCRLHFGTIAMGQVETLPVTITNNQKVSVTISAVNSSDGAFSAPGLSLPAVIAAGQTLSFNVVFTPSAKGWVGATMTLTSLPDRALPLYMGGVGLASEALTPNPATVAFGSVSVGSTGTVPVVLTNSGNTTIVLVQTQLIGAGFGISDLAFPVTLLPKQTVGFNVTFTPQSGSAVSGSLILPNGGLTIPLTGTGTSQGTLAFSPATVNFGNVNLGTTGTQSMTASATGADVTITSSSSSSSLFVLNGASFPITISKGQSMSFNVAFTPKADGTTAGTLTFISNASDSKALEGLTGTGTTPQYTVNLSWNASSPPVVGYNVYRSNSLKGSYAKVNSALDPATVFTDTTVASGQTYYYEATSVNSSGEESGYSTPVSAVVP